jgi:hypothetical protein
MCMYILKEYCRTDKQTVSDTFTCGSEINNFDASNVWNLQVFRRNVSWLFSKGFTQVLTNTNDDIVTC